MFHIQKRINFIYSPLLSPEYIMKVERILDNTTGYSFLSNRILTSTSSPLLFPEYIMKLERIFDNTIGYLFLAEVSYESLFKIIWYIKSNKSKYQTY